MKPYVHNPQLFRAHFVGQGLPSYSGARMQRGYGLSMGKLKRFAVPLLMQGVKAAAPHISKVTKSATTAAVRKIFPNSPTAQRVAGNIVGKLTDHVVGRVVKKKVKKKRSQPYTVNRRRNAVKTTAQNIFQ